MEGEKKVAENIALVESDIAEVRPLLQAADAEGAFLPDADSPDFSVEKFLSSQAAFPNFHLFLGLNPEGEKLGFISLLNHKKEGTISIGPMYVSQKLRGKGIGGSLVKQVVSWAKDNSFKRMFTKTWGQNQGSRKIFENLGFAKIEEVPRARINGDSTISFELAL